MEVVCIIALNDTDGPGRLCSVGRVYIARHFIYNDKSDDLDYYRIEDMQAWHNPISIVSKDLFKLHFRILTPY